MKRSMDTLLRMARGGLALVVFCAVIHTVSPAVQAQDNVAGTIFCPASASFIINASSSPRSMILTLGRFDDTKPISGLSLSWTDGAFGTKTSFGPISGQSSVAIALSLAAFTALNIKCTSNFDLSWQASTLSSSALLACGNGFSTKAALLVNTTPDSLFLFFALDSPQRALIDLSWTDPSGLAQSAKLDNETSLGVAINLAAVNGRTFSDLKYSCSQDVAGWSLFVR